MAGQYGATLKVSRSRNMKQKIPIWNINFSQNTNKHRYPEQLYRLGMFMFWHIAVARPLSSASLTYLQGVSFRNGLYELDLTEIDMQVRFGLKMVLECWDREFLGTTIIFQKK